MVMIRFISVVECSVRIRVIIISKDRGVVRPKPRFSFRAKFSTRIKFRFMVWIRNGIKPRVRFT